ncbi:hypothetical protein K2173_016642 [Erythroxylum novogranatense]|uniref:Cation/H+ exchanger domain-containing protein n=1 Tax=Erythroxylum novogranatense TaxID=1862640 RepID=A0AAV8SH36_9ROSI|nr:hypothetical protein K2173_016642 [Erythroxylum novogranatense]
MNNTATTQFRIWWVCQSPKHARSRGYFYGHAPLTYPTSTLLAQLIVAALLSLLVQFILTPLGQSAFTSMMLVGFALGPSVWGKNNEIMAKLYPQKSYYVNQTVSLFGCALFMFVVGSKMDMGMIKRSGRKAVVIGILSFTVPLTLNLLVARFLSATVEMETTFRNSLYYIAVCQSVSSFHVIACLLADLKLLNSELGRLALSSSMISGTSSWALTVVVLTIRQGSLGPKTTIIWELGSALFLVMFIVFALRPAMIWMVRTTTEGKSVRENYIFFVFVMVLCCSLGSEFIGQHFIFGPMALGMAVPEGPPLGSALVNRLESVVVSVLLPSYFVFSVIRVDVFSIRSETVAVLSVMCMTSFLGKLFAAMLPALLCKMPPIDALSFGLIMSSQGITDVMILQHIRILFIIDEQIYSVLVVAIMLLSGIFTPIIKMLYQPSKQFLLYKKMTIEQASANMELRVLACIYHRDGTPSIVSLLEISNPTAKNPICCYVFHLIELAGRLSPLLMSHRPGKVDNTHGNHSTHILKAFRSFERENIGSVVANVFTAISPFATAYEEVCRLALDNRTSLIIAPFHRQWTLNGIEDFPKLRGVNRQILLRAPCSVGIFIDRGTLCGATLRSSSMYNIGIIFVHGKDDREALAYGMRMAEHPSVSVSLIRINDRGQTALGSKASIDLDLDKEIISEFKIAAVGKKHHVYKEQTAKDSVELVNLVRSLENSYDLILVGRQHSATSPMFAGLDEWNEFPELGVLGDMLASSDSGCEVSVLVMQQQGFGVEDDTRSLMPLKEDLTAIAVDIPRKSSKVFPI